MFNKIDLLSRFLKIEFDDAKALLDSGDYLVLDENESDLLCEDYINDVLYKIDAEFLAEYSCLSVDSIVLLQEDLNDDSNQVLLESLNKSEELYNDIIREDGRSYLITGQEENEFKTDGYFIYKMI